MSRVISERLLLKQARCTGVRLRLSLVLTDLNYYVSIKRSKILPYEAVAATCKAVVRAVG